MGWDLYMHHEIVLKTPPLCLTRMYFDPTANESYGCYVAIGGTTSRIDVWDIDDFDPLEPVISLGSENYDTRIGNCEHNSLKRAKKINRSLVDKNRNGHFDSILCLCWNPLSRNVLASGSADHTVKIWEISKKTCEHTHIYHEGNVNSVSWNPNEAHVLLTGSADRKTALIDMRSPHQVPITWLLSSSVNSVTWNPFDPSCFLVSTLDGTMTAFDTRWSVSSDNLFRLNVHNKTSYDVAFNHKISGLIATCGADKKIKLWDIYNYCPSELATRFFDLGHCFTLGFCPTLPFILAAGGLDGQIFFWDIKANKSLN
jgi:periodic tryptophan protein 1